MNTFTIRVIAEPLFWSDVEKASKEFNDIYGVKAEYHMDYMYDTYWILNGNKDELKKLIANCCKQYGFHDCQDVVNQLESYE